MREIAREVWYEKNRLGLPYKSLKLFKAIVSSNASLPLISNRSTSEKSAIKGTSVAPIDSDRRIVLFAHYDKDGIIDDHVVNYLKCLQRISGRILFVSDCELRPSEARKLKGIAEVVFASHHGEYDFGSWSRGFAALNYDLSDWDELVIANDSCYAPLFPLERVFRMVGPCDFWGATSEPYSRLSADIAARRAERVCQEEPSAINRVDKDFRFINSYFMVFRKSVLGNASFLDFWKSIKRQKDKEQVIEIYEIGLTKLLLALNFRSMSFAVRQGTVRYEKFDIDVPKNFQMPWLRVMICKQNEELIDDLDEQLNSINYPRFLIDNHIERIIGTAKPSHYFLRTKHSIIGHAKLALRARFKVVLGR